MRAAELVSWNLKRIRVRQGVSQEKLALDADVDRSYVGRLERSQENPTVEVLERLATALGAKVGDLFRVPAKNERARSLPGGRRKAP
ncbi:MAG: transcriptional regulator, family [Spartobacteria bacterium]|nr:transcriptional regulator, family [Spartobacteria bacterium]